MDKHEWVRFCRHHLEELANAWRSDVYRIARAFPEDVSPLNAPSATLKAAYHAQWALCADGLEALLRRYAKTLDHAFGAVHESHLAGVVDLPPMPRGPMKPATQLPLFSGDDLPESDERRGRG